MRCVPSTVGGLQRCVESFSRMRSRRVLVLRLVVWGLGVDPKSVRSVRKRPRCVRKRSRCVRQRSRRKLSRNAELSCWTRGTRVGSSRLNSVNSHRGRGGPGRETQNCRHFWTRPVSSRLKSVNNHGDRRSWWRTAELSSLLDLPLERRKERGEKKGERREK